MPKRYDNTIYRPFLRSKKIIKATLSNITIIGLIVYIKDPKEAPSVDHAYIKENTKAKKTTIANIITTSYSIKSDTISVIN